MSNAASGNSQVDILLRLSREELETAIVALSFSIKDAFNALEYNWDVDAYHGLTTSSEMAVDDIDKIAGRIERGRALLARLSALLDNPAKDLALSRVEFERLGYALYTYGVTGFHRALCATRTKIGFTNNEDKSRVIDKLNQQNERAFALFKRLEQHNKGVPWMVWPQANMEDRFAPGR